jgi:hypothetical protein
LRNCKITDSIRRAVKIKVIDEDLSEGSSEEDRYYINKIENRCRNCNLIFGLGNKLRQYLRNCKASDNIRRVTKIKIKPTIIVPDKNISILKFLREFKSDSENYFRIFYYATIKILLNQENKFTEIYLNTDCGISIINRI